MEYKPMTKSRLLTTDLVFTKDQFNKIKNGFVAPDMDYKWDIIYEDDWLHFCRSWTGNEVYKAKIEKTNDETYEINQFYAKTDDSKTNDEYDRFMLSNLIDSYLM